MTMIQGLVPRFHEAGKIKVGRSGQERTGRQGKKYRLPEKLDHFLVTTAERGPDGNFKPDPIMQELGEAPTEIMVRLIFDSIEESFDNSYAVFIGGKCICSGDGIKGQRKETVRGSSPIRLTGESKDVDCGQKCPFFKYRTGEPAQKFGAGTCKPYGVLRVTLEGAQEVGGVYIFRTTSLNTIQSIRTSLAYIQMQAGGILSGLPLKMVFTKRQATTADGTKTTIPVVNIVFAGSQQQLRETALETAKLRSASQLEMGQVRKSLQLISMKDTAEDEEEVNAEFHPESVNVQVIDETPRANATPEEVEADAERFGDALPADAFDKRGAGKAGMKLEVADHVQADYEATMAVAKAEDEQLADRNAKAAEILGSPGEMTELIEAPGLGDSAEGPELMDPETGEIVENGMSENEKKLLAEAEKRKVLKGMDW